MVNALSALVFGVEWGEGMKEKECETGKCPSEFQHHVELLGRSLGARAAKLMYILEFPGHLLSGFTGKTTL